MAGDLIVSFVLSLFYKGYKSLKMSISALGNPSSPVRIPFNIWMLIEGVLFLISLPAVCSYFHPVSGGITVVMLVFIVRIIEYSKLLPAKPEKQLTSLPKCI